MNSEGNETLYMRMLLMHGGDPEPDNPNPSDVYSDWHYAVLNTFEELNADENKGRQMHNYVNWLKAQGLHNEPPDEPPDE